MSMSMGIDDGNDRILGADPSFSLVLANRVFPFACDSVIDEPDGQTGIDPKTILTSDVHCRHSNANPMALQSCCIKSSHSCHVTEVSSVW